jgi:hypothetical protein
VSNPESRAQDPKGNAEAKSRNAKYLAAEQVLWQVGQGKIRKISLIISFRILNCNPDLSSLVSDAF